MSATSSLLKRRREIFPGVDCLLEVLSNEFTVSDFLSNCSMSAMVLFPAVAGRALGTLVFLIWLLA